jgi:hypothetical protein
MIITALVLFAVLSLAEFIFVYIKWTELSDIHSIARTVSTIAGKQNRYDEIWARWFTLCMRFKWVIYVLAAVALAVNAVVAMIVTLAVHLNIVLYHLIANMQW